MEALADRIIPPDPQTPGGKDSGCAVFVDRQLAGAYGAQEGLYVRPPFINGAKNQGPQSEGGPAQGIPRRARGARQGLPGPGGRQSVSPILPTTGRTRS